MIQYFSKGAEAIFYVTMCSLLLQVYNSSSLRADSLMGEFKVRLKSEVKKWITLKVCNNNVFFNVFNVSGWCWLHLRRTLYVSEIPHCSLIHVLLLMFTLTKQWYCVCSLLSTIAHCVMRKWLLLNVPDDSSFGAKGYLKVSMFIVGTGDEPPVLILSNRVLTIVLSSWDLNILM